MTNKWPENRPSGWCSLTQCPPSEELICQAACSYVSPILTQLTVVWRVLTCPCALRFLMPFPRQMNRSGQLTTWAAFGTQCECPFYLHLQLISIPILGAELRDNFGQIKRKEGMKMLESWWLYCYNNILRMYARPGPKLHVADDVQPRDTGTCCPRTKNKSWVGYLERSMLLVRLLKTQGSFEGRQICQWALSIRREQRSTQPCLFRM